MPLRDQARPLARLGEVSPTSRKLPVVAPDVPAPVMPGEHSFSPAVRQAGWRVALNLQVSQRRMQRSKGVR